MGLFDSIKGAIFGKDRTPAHEWVIAAVAIITEPGDDPGDWPQDEAAAALRDWWEIPDRLTCLSRLESLGQGAGAWDLLRSIHVSRMGVGAGYLSYEEAMAHCAKAGARLQREISDWASLAVAYWQARKAWAEEGGYEQASDAENQSKLGRLHIEAWAGVDFKTQLGPSA